MTATERLSAWMAAAGNEPHTLRYVELSMGHYGDEVRLFIGDGVRVAEATNRDLVPSTNPKIARREVIVARHASLDAVIDAVVDLADRLGDGE